MKSRSSLALFLVLLVIVLSRTIFLRQEPAQNFPATINSDCAPWDGPAFTVSVQYDPLTVIYISIWRAPDIKFQSTFPMPSGVDAEQDGFAYILPKLGPFVPLSGEVSFQRVEMGIPVEGRFNFTSERGGQFEGRFIAAWGNEVAFCG